MYTVVDFNKDAICVYVFFQIKWKKIKRSYMKASVIIDL